MPPSVNQAICSVYLRGPIPPIFDPHDLTKGALVVSRSFLFPLFMSTRIDIDLTVDSESSPSHANCFSIGSWLGKRFPISGDVPKDLEDHCTRLLQIPHSCRLAVSPDPRQSIHEFLLGTSVTQSASLVTRTAESCFSSTST